MRHEEALAALATASSWRKSTFSTANGCVEVGPVPGIVGVRDTKLGAESPVLAFPPGAWAGFTALVR